MEDIAAGCHVSLLLSFGAEEQHDLIRSNAVEDRNSDVAPPYGGASLISTEDKHHRRLVVHERRVRV